MLYKQSNKVTYLYHALCKDDDNKSGLLHGFSHITKDQYLAIDVIYIYRVKKDLSRLRQITALCLKPVLNEQ